MGLVWTNNTRIFEYTPKKFFISLVQLAIEVRRQRDEEFFSAAVAETLNLRATCSPNIQTKNPNRHKLTKCMND